MELEASGCAFWVQSGEVCSINYLSLYLSVRAENAENSDLCESCQTIDRQIVIHKCVCFARLWHWLSRHVWRISNNYIVYYSYIVHRMCSHLRIWPHYCDEVIFVFQIITVRLDYWRGLVDNITQTLCIEYIRCWIL